MAFGVSALFTVLTALTGLFVFDRANEQFVNLTENHLPEVVQVADFARTGGEIIAMAPTLLTASDEAARQRVQAELDRLMGEMTGEIARLEVTDSGQKGALGERVLALRENLERLRKEVRAKEAEEMRLNEQLSRLRWLYADLLSEIEPLNQDLAYNLDTEVERFIAATRGDTARETAVRLRKNRATGELLAEIGSNGVLLAGLLIQASTAEDADALYHLETLSEDAASLIEKRRDALLPDASNLTLRQTLSGLIAFARGADGILAVRKRALSRNLSSQAILAENRILVEHIRADIQTIVAETRKDAQKAASRTAEMMKRARVLLVFMILLSVVSSVAMAVFYVRGNIVRRLSALSTSMQAVAEGDLDHPVPMSANDEIGRMADALRGFRKVAVDLNRTNDALEAEIRHRKRTEDELVQAGKLAALGQLTAGIAHELNQPLSAMRHYLHNAVRFLERGNRAAHDETIGRVDGLMDRMAGRIRHLKSFARWSSDQVAPVPVKESIKEAVSLLEPRLKGGGVRLVDTVPEQGIRVMAEPIRLEQILVNLLSNAVDAVAEVSEPRIDIRASEEENRVRIAVEDNGCGMSEETRTRIFDPFFTTKEVGHGLGLGLSISFNIAKDFGGTLEAVPMEDGTTFLLTLPKYQG